MYAYVYIDRCILYIDAYVYVYVYIYIHITPTTFDGGSHFTAPFLGSWHPNARRRKEAPKRWRYERQSQIGSGRLGFLQLLVGGGMDDRYLDPKGTQDVSP